MSDLISRDALNEALSDWNLMIVLSAEEAQKTGEWRVVLPRVEVLRRLMNAPTVDAVPVVHARWVPHKDGVMLGCTAYRCSACGRVEEENSEPYCHCGAKMDAPGGDDDA